MPLNYVNNDNRSTPAKSLRARLSTLFCAAAMLAGLLLGQAAFAQAEEVPLAGVLPGSTIVAMFAQPDAASNAVFEDLFAELDLDEARQTIAKLGEAFGEVAEEMLSEFDALRNSSDLEGLLEELTGDCNELSTALAAADAESVAGRLAIGVSSSSFNPVPAMVAAMRPTDTALGTTVFEALTSCYDSGVAMSEGEVPLYVLGDGGDFPVIVAKVGDTILAASDPEITRAMVRLAGGSNEPSLLDQRVGRLARGITERGFAVTLDLAGLADVLEPFLPMLGGGQSEVRPLERLLATLRVVNGVAAGFSLDEGGLVIDSLVSVDAQLAEATGELALLDMLNCAGCTAAAPSLIPAGAAGVSRWSFSLASLATWLDGWLADVGPLVGEELSLDGLAEEALGADTGKLGLDWLGDTWHFAQLDVYGTDAGDWLQGPGAVSTVPVSSEDAARAGIQAWLDALDNAPTLLAELLGEEELDAAAFADGMDLLSAISIRPVSYRGVAYDRVRAPFTGDYGLAVMAGHLVTTQPASAMEAVIDVYLGSPSIADDPVFGPLIASQPAAPASYEIVDLPRYLNGFASVTDLAAGPLASTMMVATWAAVEEYESDLPEGETSKFDAESLPSFDEYIGLADLATEFLELLATRTGLSIGSSESIDGVRWSTWRAPLR